MAKLVLREVSSDVSFKKTADHARTFCVGVPSGLVSQKAARASWAKESVKASQKLVV